MIYSHLIVLFSLISGDIETAINQTDDDIVVCKENIQNQIDIQQYYYLLGKKKGIEDAYKIVIDRFQGK